MEVNRIIFWMVFLTFGVTSSVVGVTWFVQRIRFRRKARQTRWQVSELSGPVFGRTRRFHSHEHFETAFAVAEI
jgi:hypothetical protein